MANTTLEGEVDIEYEQGNDGHRDYFVTWLVSAKNKWVGPHMIMDTAGLPVPGTGWTFGPESDREAREEDVYAVCQGYAKVVPKVTDGPNLYWLVRQQFSTRPFERKNMVAHRYTDPFTEEVKVRGAFVKKSEEALRALSIKCVEDNVAHDMRSDIIRNTAWQRFSGKNVEFDRGMPRILIQKNFGDNGNNINYFERWINHVNDDTMWGYVPRSVKLDDVSYERMVYAQDLYFFVANLEFEIDQRYDPVLDEYYSGHDRRLTNYGDEELMPGGNPNNPLHFKAIRKVPDRERSKIVLDYQGKPWKGDVDDATVTPPYIDVQYWLEADFITEFGIPASI